MPVWLEKDAPRTSSASLSFMNQLATGVPLRPSTPQASGWSSGIWPLALNVVITGAPSCSASAMIASMSKRAPWPTMITGRLAPREQLDRRSQRLARRGDLLGRDTALGPDGCFVAGRERLDLVGKDQVGDVAAQDRVLRRQARQLGVAAGREHRLAEGGHRAVGRVQVDLLEGAGAQHLRVDLSGQGDHRRAVDLRVPEARQQVRRSGAGDRQARRRPARELAVGRGGERGGALVADADIAQVCPCAPGGAARRRGRGSSARPCRTRGARPS